MDTGCASTSALADVDTCAHCFFFPFFPSLSFSPTSDYVSGDTGFVAHTNTSKSFLQFPHLPFFHTGMKNEV